MENIHPECEHTSETPTPQLQKATPEFRIGAYSIDGVI